MKIIPQTTLAQLELERMRLGITSMLTTLKTVLDPATGLTALRVEVMCVATDGMVQASGATIPDAIAAAFELREQQIGELLPTTSAIAVDTALTVTRSTPFEPAIAAEPYRCVVPMCGESGVCAECRKRGAR